MLGVRVRNSRAFTGRLRVLGALEFAKGITLGPPTRAYVQQPYQTKCHTATDEHASNSDRPPYSTVVVEWLVTPSLCSIGDMLVSVHIPSSVVPPNWFRSWRVFFSWTCVCMQGQGARLPSGLLWEPQPSIQARLLLQVFSRSPES